MQRIEGAGGGYFSVATPEGKKIKIQNSLCAIFTLKSFKN